MLIKVAGSWFWKNNRGGNTLSAFPELNSCGGAVLGAPCGVSTFGCECVLTGRILEATEAAAPVWVCATLM